jgi:hypothetical protein
MNTTNSLIIPLHKCEMLSLSGSGWKQDNEDTSTACPQAQLYSYLRTIRKGLLCACKTLYKWEHSLLICHSLLAMVGRNS